MNDRPGRRDEAGGAAPAVPPTAASGAEPAPASAEPASVRRRVLAFAAVVAVCVAGALAYALRHSAQVAARAQAASAGAPVVATAPLDELPAPGRPFLLFRSTALGDTYGRISIEWLDAAGGPRLVSPLQCDRVHVASAAPAGSAASGAPAAPGASITSSRGICLEARRGVATSYHAHLFDRRFAITHSFPLAGPPSRARMSPDGRFAAVTVFVTGHSYASTGFTTRTSLIDVAAGTLLVDDLEKLEVQRDGQLIKANDFNFWGVTFTRDGQRFYATLGTAGKALLVEGDVATRRMRVLHDNVECPSLSPDNLKIGFKRRQPADAQGRVAWGLHVLELASGKETALRAETRNVDDQVEWLDDRELLYALPDDGDAASAATHVWAISADGSGAPRRLMPQAFSPAVVR